MHKLQATLSGILLGLAVACTAAPQAAPTTAPTTAPAPATKPPASPAAASPAPSAAPSPAAAASPSPAAKPAASPAASPAVAAASPSAVPCSFVLGMASARDRFGANVVGNCLEDERPIAANGNFEQRTTNGLLVLRDIDGRYLFIGRDQTSIDRDGNGTIVTRPNNQRLDWEGDRQLMESIQKGGYVIYFRHGSTDPNQRDSDPNNLANCATQRNLTDAGREQARTIGQAIKALNVPVGKVLTSEYCRAKEYSQLLFGQPAQVEPSLVLPDPLPEATQQANTAALKKLLSEAQPGTSNIFLVSHSPNIRQATGADLPVEGGSAIMKVTNGNPEVVARLLPTDWTDLATALATH